MAKQSKSKQISTWVILGLLFFGLIGFGATGLSGNIRTIGSVGDQDITVQEYATALNNQIRALEAQTGQPIPFTMAQSIGIPQVTLAQLMQQKALDSEAARIGLSVGDLAVAEEIQTIPAFQGLGGNFSREAYEFALEQQGLREADFETALRADIARSFLQGAVVAGVSPPEGYAEILSRFAGEERDIRIINVTRDALLEMPGRPGDEALQSFHSENAELFTAPETRRVSYAWVTPDMLQDEVELDEAALQELYEARSAEFNQPERRLVERLVMESDAAAEEALAQLAVEALTFDALVTQRGLTLNDVDLGDVTEADLEGAGAEVFAAEVGDVVGPLPSTFGPALYRVNAVLAPVEISFEEALPDLREELSIQAARRLIDAAQEDLFDLVAGGATIEEIAASSDMVEGQIDFSEEVTEGIAAYAAFRAAAAAAEPGAFLELETLEDGGLFVAEVTEVVPPTLRPFEDVRDEVEAALVADLEMQEIMVVTERFASLILSTGDVTEDMPEALVQTGLTRRSFVADAAEGLIEEVFGVGEGGLAMAEGEDFVSLAIVDAVRAPDPEDGDVAARAEAIGAQAASAIADDILSAFMEQIQQESEVQINQNAITAVHTQFQ